jgi:anti-sigma factor RsiW
MYDCKKILELIGPYIDNELETVPTKEVAQHLESCASCRRELETLRLQSQLLSRAIKSEICDTRNLRGLVEAATIRKHSVPFPDLNLVRLMPWAMAGALVVVLAVAGLFYLPGKFSVAQAHPLYQAAVNDHLTFSSQRSASDWIVAQAAIVEQARQFLHNMNPPLRIADQYELVRARLCQLSGETFLHLVYVTADGRQASLFVCTPAHEIPMGDKQFTLNGNSVQSVETGGLHLASVLKGDCLLIATAREKDTSVAILTGFAI